MPPPAPQDAGRRGAARQGRSFKAVVSVLWAAAWRFRGRTVLAVGLLLLAKLASVGVPLVLKQIIDRLSTPAELATAVTASGAAAFPPGAQFIVLPVFLLIGYAALRFCSTLFTELRDLCFARVTLATVADFAQRALAHLHRLGPRFHVQHPMGGLVRDVDRGAAALGFLLGALLFTLLPTLVEIGAVIAIMSAAYSAWFIAILLLTFVAYAVYTALMTRRRVLLQRRVNALDSRANGLLMDGLLNLEAVRAHARAAQEVGRYSSARSAWVDRGVDSQKALSSLHLGQGAIIAFGVGASMLLAGQETVRGTMTVGDLVLVNAYVLQVCLPLNALGLLFREARDAMTNAERLWSLLGTEPEIVDRPRAAQLAITRGEVVFEHVDFGYEAGRQVLWDVSFRIEPGQTVAVVGGSGSGKSTLARLLLRLYDPQRGRVLIDGTDIAGVTLASLRAGIGLVPQDSTLFNESITYNIAYGRPGASMAEVLEAARAAQVDEFIASLPERFDTVVGERGMKLSGGEKQRIAIARAFLKNAPILVLDEATSALDTRSERAIQGQLDQLSKGRSTLVIAHRLSTIVDADLILVLDRGRIVERGRHDQLLEHGGLYAQLWDLQRQKQAFDRMERRLARQPVNLAALLANVIDGLRPRLDERATQLYTAIDTEGVSVSADPGVLSQVLWELCTRAVEATAPGGRVGVRLERQEARVRLTVTDGARGGVGAAAAVVASNEPPLDPLMLRSAIERQGGQFALVPASSVQGMRFVVELPLPVLAAAPAAPREPAAVPAAAPAPGEQRLAGLCVMVIDDAQLAREALQATLQAQGATTLGFAGGAGALQWLEQHDTAAWPQVLVCDVALGEDEDGHSVMRRVRRAEGERGVSLEQRISAVALTTADRNEQRMLALMSGFQVQLGKPVEPGELVATVAALAGRGQ